jgi:hypothetical protein
MHLAVGFRAVVEPGHHPGAMFMPAECPDMYFKSSDTKYE